MLRAYPSLLPLTAIVLGIVVGEVVRMPSWLLLCAVSIIGVSILFWRTSNTLFSILIALILLLSSSVHYSVRFVERGERHVGNFADAKTVYQLYASISDWPDLRANRTELKLDIDSLAELNGQSRQVEGSLLLKIADTTTLLQRGDRLEFFGKVYPLNERPTEGFNYGRYLRLKGVSGVVYLPTALTIKIQSRSSTGFFARVDQFRHQILRVFQQRLSAEGAAIVAGLLLGHTRDIPSEVYERFRQTGTLHLLAVSGSNVGLVLLFCWLVLRPVRIGPRARAGLLLGVVFVFAYLSYGEPSVVRASLMAALVLIGRVLGRRLNLNNVISTTAVIVLLVSPSQLFDIGFQLSFVTAWGLIFIVPRLSAALAQPQTRAKKAYRWLVIPLLVTLVAQVCSAPLQLLYFGQIPANSLLSNSLIGPLVSVTVVLALLMLLVHVLLPILSLVVAIPVNLLVTLVINLLQWLSTLELNIELPMGIETFIVPVALALAVYIMLLLVVLSLKHIAARRAFLMLGFVLLNSALLATMVRSHSVEADTVTVHSIPGGMAVDYFSQARHSRDVTITGLRHRDYPLDSKVLHPTLGQRNDVPIGRLFILSCDFPALDDIQRFARAQNITGLWLHHSLKPRWSDVMRADSSPLPFTVNYFYGLSLSDAALTSVPDGSVLVMTDDYCVVVTRDMNVTGFHHVSNAHAIIDSRGLTPEECFRLKSSGYSTVLCSKITQLDETEGLPDGCIDLQRQGRTVIRLR